MRLIVSFCLSMIVLSCITFVPQFMTTEDTESLALAPLIILGTAFIFGLLALLPVVMVWVLLWLVLEKLGVATRLRAVLAMGPAAGIGAYAVGQFLHDFSGGFGEASPLPGLREIMIVVLVSMAVAFLTWTVLPQEGADA